MLAEEHHHASGLQMSYQQMIVNLIVALRWRVCCCQSMAPALLRCIVTHALRKFGLILFSPGAASLSGAH